MTKEEAKNKLRAAGYRVVDDNSVVTVLIPADASLKNTLKDVKEKLKNMGYDASFSIRQVKDAGDDKEAEDEKDAASYDEAFEDNETADETTEDDDVTEPGDDSASESDAVSDNEVSEDTDKEDDGIEYFDDEDSDMLLTGDAIQFSLDDFGLDF